MAVSQRASFELEKKKAGANAKKIQEHAKKDQRINDKRKGIFSLWPTLLFRVNGLREILQ